MHRHVAKLTFPIPYTHLTDSPAISQTATMDPKTKTTTAAAAAKTRKSIKKRKRRKKRKSIRNRPATAEATTTMKTMTTTTMTREATTVDVRNGANPGAAAGEERGTRTARAKKI